MESWFAAALIGLAACGRVLPSGPGQCYMKSSPPRRREQMSIYTERAADQYFLLLPLHSTHAPGSQLSA